MITCVPLFPVGLDAGHLLVSKGPCAKIALMTASASSRRITGRVSFAVRHVLLAKENPGHGLDFTRGKSDQVAKMQFSTLFKVACTSGDLNAKYN